MSPPSSRLPAPENKPLSFISAPVSHVLAFKASGSQDLHLVTILQVHGVQIAVAGTIILHFRENHAKVLGLAFLATT